MHVVLPPDTPSPQSKPSKARHREWFCSVLHPQAPTEATPAQAMQRSPKRIRRLDGDVAMEEAETQPDDTATEPDESGTEDHGPPPPVFVEQDVRAADNEATAEGAEPLAPPTPVVPRQWGLADMWVVDLPLHAGDPADTELFLGELAAWTEQDPRHDLSGVYGEDRSAEGDIHLRFEAVESWWTGEAACLREFALR